MSYSFSVPSPEYNEALMNSVARPEPDERAALPQLRELGDRMFSRAAGALRISGNQVRLLEDALLWSAVRLRRSLTRS